MAAILYRFYIAKLYEPISFHNIKRKLMKSVFILVLVLSSSITAQNNLFNKDYEIQKFIENGGKVSLISSDVYKFIYPDGNARVFNFNKNKNLNVYNTPVDTTIINIWEIDTTKYSSKFTFWQRVEIKNGYTFVPPFVDDLNRNGKPEIYGFHHADFPPSGPVEIYERGINDIFNSVYAYPDSATIFVKAMGEIHGNGEKEIYIHHRDYNSGVVYKSDSIGVLPTTFDFIFYYEPNQINDMTFGDFDQNGITDCAFVDASTPSKIIIGEFRKNINNFSSVFEQTTDGETPSGFAISDFDEDKKMELVVGTGEGNVYVIENRSENFYEISWNGIFPMYNAYMKASTKDIDGNGRPEFWIGGQDFPEGITRFQCYEAVGDYNYETLAVIELRYINSLSTNYLQSKDIDDDGQEELIISLANVILILKFTGSPNNHQYDIYYAKIGEATEPTAEFEPLTPADLDGDNKTDILLPFYKYENGQSYNFSYILKQNGTVGVGSLNTKPNNSDNYVKSFPVPFNSASSINFAISKESFVKLKVYNSLGKEIRTLLEKELSPGEYNIQWEVRDEYGRLLPSGIYFISLQTGNVIKTTKTILLK
ncbi:MAG: FG-GAP-like repeat-containing protein [Ignavibacteria bacterium]|nr:FG-GAP-like repeat-containing protein [Ignavibacteria bacterium]